MVINWMMIAFLVLLGLPGVLVAMPRIIYFLLPDNTQSLKNKFSGFAVIQSFIMVVVMSITGTILSQRTGLQDNLLDSLSKGTASLPELVAILLPALVAALVALTVFCFCYYVLVSRILDKQSIQSMRNLRAALGVWGCVLYGGIVEEIIARWGLMSLTVFFIALFVKSSNLVVVMSIVISGIMFALGQIPAYVAIGCVSSRRLFYSIILLSLCQSVVFGLVFWWFGILCAMLAHMMFHLGWAFFDKKTR